VDGTRVRHAAKLYCSALENRAYLELARLLADPALRGHGVPGGDGRAVLLLPGYLAGDRSLSLLGTTRNRSRRPSPPRPIGGGEHHYLTVP
jgi:hypothetical protein